MENLGHQIRRWPHFDHPTLHRLVRGVHISTFPRCAWRQKTASLDDLALQHAEQDARRGDSLNRR